ncbi:hypothetical protein Apa02nite_006410 [Actinoplanes palleronii]|uniref:Uncharacterized protein n=1 Tax=Actinoplanes palleronii TaxID=113570 RepID=A0ABQ4B1I6_9ACTN|nr:hypothetical protein Apa02nite_006410 [Actinoplanes palleronii]
MQEELAHYAVASEPGRRYLGGTLAERLMAAKIATEVVAAMTFDMTPILSGDQMFRARFATINDTDDTSAGTPDV